MRYANEVPNDDLYIPHGSDESERYFLSPSFSQYFISHMVQMKVFIDVIRHQHVKMLYIPHGSDERRITNISILNLFSLYIPHGSDESSLCFFFSKST